jgi:hypothetical protein
VIKKTFAVLVILVLAVMFWFVFGLWTGIYSVYSYPPSKERPDGATLVIARDEGEPMFNSPQHTGPVIQPTPARGGIVFAAPMRPKRPVDVRTIVEFPFVQWAYDKSLEPETTE